MKDKRPWEKVWNDEIEKDGQKLFPTKSRVLNNKLKLEGWSNSLKLAIILIFLLFVFSLISFLCLRITYPPKYFVNKKYEIVLTGKVVSKEKNQMFIRFNNGDDYKFKFNSNYQQTLNDYSVNGKNDVGSYSGIQTNIDNINNIQMNSVVKIMKEKWTVKNSNGFLLGYNLNSYVKKHNDIIKYNYDKGFLIGK